MTTLVRAFGQAVRQCPSIRLVIAGDGEQAAEIRELASACCPAGTVCFSCLQNEKDTINNPNDLKVLTTHSETIPNRSGYCRPGGPYADHCLRRTGAAADAGGAL